jgi:histidinol phosphatase-like enzyme
MYVPSSWLWLQKKWDYKRIIMVGDRAKDMKARINRVASLSIGWVKASDWFEDQHIASMHTAGVLACPALLHLSGYTLPF